MKLPKSLPKRKKRSLLALRRVVGKSMVPTLRPNQIVLSTGLFHTIRPNQIVVVYHDGIEKIKRIQKIDHERIFVVGDNERSSIDSRSFGWLSQEAVLAVLLWPRG